MIKKGRLLAFLYIFPPKQGTAAIRNYNQFRELSESFEHSYLFTNALNIAALDNVNATSVSSLDYRKFLKSDGTGQSEKTKNNWLSQFLIKLINTFPVNIILGEGGGYYLIKSYYKAKKLINSENITHIYSSYRPFVDHYIAYKLKQKYKDLIWIADFRDLIVDPHYDQQFFPKWQQRLYKKIFKSADIITTVSDGLVNKLHEYSSVVLAIKNGIEAGYELPKAIKVEKFSIVYTGAMFLDERNGAPLFAALRNLIDQQKIDSAHIKVVYAGKDKHQWQHYANKYQLNDILDCVGQISHEEAMKLQRSACINVLLSIASDQLSGVSTGKFIEYLKAASPILAIYKNKNDESMRSKLQELHIGSAFSDQTYDLMDIQEFIVNEYNYWLKKRENRKPLNIDKFKNKYDRKQIFKPLIELI